MRIRKAWLGLVLVVTAAGGWGVAQQERSPAARPAPAPPPATRVRPAPPPAAVPAELRQAAENMLNQMRSEEDGWTAESRLGSAYPIYLPGFSEPAYYEFKVTNGNSPAGYILVNANETDLLIPELSMRGPTLTEIYRQGLGDRPCRIYRYGWFNSAALSLEDSPKLLASMGFLGQPGLLRAEALRPQAGQALPSAEQNLDQQLLEFHGRLGQLLQQKKALPLFQEGTLGQIYQTMKAHGGPGRLPVAKGSRPSTSTRLVYRFDPDWHTPAWSQPHRDNSPVGCGNTAWAIVYAYWKQFKGKSGLFGIDLAGRCFDYSGEPTDVMWELGRLTDTSYGRYWGGGECNYYGRTMPSNMPAAIRYAHEHGCPEATVVKYNSGERSKFWEIHDEITADRPVILLVNEGCGNTGFGLIPYHYVVIERTRYVNQPGVDSYGYYVNMGHGSNPSSGFPHKWLMTVRQGLDDSAFSAYFIRMNDTGTPLPFQIVVDGRRGRDTLCLERPRLNVSFHLENLRRDCDEGRVEVFKDGVLLQTVTGLEDMATRELNLAGGGQRLLLRARCGSRQAEKTVYLDYDPPTVRRWRVTAEASRPRSQVLLAEGLQDDGYWNPADYLVEARLDNSRTYSEAGTSLLLTDLAPGAHTATVRIRDGCNRWSSTQTVSFTISASAPTLRFVHPPAEARVRRGGNLSITVEAGAESGVLRLSIYLDRISDDEFNSTRLAYFPGTFGTDRPVQKTQSVRADWSRGRHTLIAVAVDNSGRTTRADQVVQVE